ncbi:MAG: DUF3307 domain-containing protein [Lachnospiraceae bacterium]|nr:DUF3307 domain-containing protein [Lachnospiraceae bacterium]
MRYNVILLLTMIFLHIVDDFYLQGKLADYKQKSWWKNNYPDELYKNDYIIALLIHSFSWSFMITVPMIVDKYNTLSQLVIIITVLINMLVHALVDDLKANELKLSLLQDQLIHLMQIVCTWLVLSIV